jgi:hypothetical protein
MCECRLEVTFTSLCIFLKIKSEHAKWFSDLVTAISMSYPVEINCDDVTKGQCDLCLEGYPNPACVCCYGSSWYMTYPNMWNVYPVLSTGAAFSPYWFAGRDRWNHGYPGPRPPFPGPGPRPPFPGPGPRPRPPMPGPGPRPPLPGPGPRPPMPGPGPRPPLLGGSGVGPGPRLSGLGSGPLSGPGPRLSGSGPGPLSGFSGSGPRSGFSGSGPRSGFSGGRR